MRFADTKSEIADAQSGRSQFTLRELITENNGDTNEVVVGYQPTVYHTGRHKTPILCYANQRTTKPL